MAQMNHAVAGVHTVFLPSASAHSFLASKFIRDIARFGRRRQLDGAAAASPSGSRRSTRDDRPARAPRRRHGRAPGPTAERLRALLRRVADIISSAKTMPLSSSRDDQPRRDPRAARGSEQPACPRSCAQARWLLKERDEFLAKTRREGDDILDAARAQAERMVQRTEVVRAAEHRARQIVDVGRGRGAPAAPRGRGLLRPALAQFEIVLDKVLRTVQAGRERLAHRPARARGARSRSRGGQRGGVLRPGPGDRRSLQRTRHAGRATCCATRARGVTSRSSVRAAEIDVGDAAVPEGADRRDRRSTSRRSTTASWSAGRCVRRGGAVCRRCLGPAHGELVGDDARGVREARPRHRADDEVFPIAADSIDLGPAVHDALALELPLAPLCRDACAGPLPDVRRRPQPRSLQLPSRPRPTRAGLRSTCSSSSTRRGSTRAPRLASLSRPASLEGSRAMAVPKKKKSKAKSRSRRASRLDARRPGPQHVPPVRRGQAAARRVRHLRLVQGPPGRRRRLTQLGCNRIHVLPIALDAMGGDHAPDEVVAGARAGRRRARHPGRPRRSGGCRRRQRGSPTSSRTEVIAMGDDPARRECGARRTRRSCAPPRRCATARRRRWSQRRQHRRHDGERRCCAWAASGAWPGPRSPRRCPCPARPRPSCSTPAPTPSASPSGSCSSRRWARCSPRQRFGIAEPRVGLLSIGEEAAKGNSFVKETHDLPRRRTGRATSSATSRAAT